MIEVPLQAGSANAHQKFSIRLGENLLDFDLNYITYTDSPAWSMDISRDGTQLVLGAMLVGGADLVASYRAGIGSLYFVGSEATLDNLGIDNTLVWSE